jgi:hypothetical protein
MDKEKHRAACRKAWAFKKRMNAITPADVKLLNKWLDQGVTIEQIENVLNDEIRKLEIKGVKYEKIT